MSERCDFYKVNAFTEKPFEGNPAALCVMSEWPSDETLQAIAADNYLSETAFMKPSSNKEESYEIRWFTPATEVALCGHATLASAHVVFQYLHPQWSAVTFHTQYSGDLRLHASNGRVAMDLPRIPAERKVNTHGLDQLETPVEAVYESDKLILRLPDEQAVRDFKPDHTLLADMHEFGVGITAPGSDQETDFVSRFFAPNAGIGEDPVTGSLHCSLCDIWQQALNKETMQARQLSPRGGNLSVSAEEDRVLVKGSARTVVKGDYFF